MCYHVYYLSQLFCPNSGFLWISAEWAVGGVSDPADKPAWSVCLATGYMDCLGSYLLE